MDQKMHALTVISLVLTKEPKRDPYGAQLGSNTKIGMCKKQNNNFLVFNSSLLGRTDELPVTILKKEKKRPN